MKKWQEVYLHEMNLSLNKVTDYADNLVIY